MQCEKESRMEPQITFANKLSSGLRLKFGDHRETAVTMKEGV